MQQQNIPIGTLVEKRLSGGHRCEAGWRGVAKPMRSG
jgi:hypothetical protein